jgi:hypothetical protein
MAWKSWDDLSDNEKRIELEKQASIICQNALGHATEIICHYGFKPSSSDTDVDAVVASITYVANSLVDWVYSKSSDIHGDIDSDNSSDVKSDVQFEMTDRQVDIMQKLYEALNEYPGLNTDVCYDDMCKYVFNKYKAFPTKYESIEKIIKEYEN